MKCEKKMVFTYLLLFISLFLWQKLLLEEVYLTAFYLAV